jgi:hypothetical protein
MIATAVPTRRREVLAIDIGTVLRPIWASVNPSRQITEKIPPFGSGAHLAPVPRGLFSPVLVFLQRSHPEQGRARKHNDKNHCTKRKKGCFRHLRILLASQNKSTECQN